MCKAIFRLTSFPTRNGQPIYQGPGVDLALMPSSDIFLNISTIYCHALLSCAIGMRFVSQSGLGLGTVCTHKVTYRGLHTAIYLFASFSVFGISFFVLFFLFFITPVYHQLMCKSKKILNTFLYSKPSICTFQAPV